MTTCFIAMPISTPNPALYHGDADHFQHVLEHLFVPAIEMAGMKPARPKAEGADLIHAEIIKQLETADLVLCDISTLNANVFFELGIRTALNRPVCIVRDEHTPTIPFDTTMINHASYMSALPAWELQRQIALLADHLRTSLERSNGENKLWKYFGLTMSGSPAIEGQDAIGDRLALMSSQIEALTMQITAKQAPNMLAASVESSASQKAQFHEYATEVAEKFDNRVLKTSFDTSGRATVKLESTPSKEALDNLSGLAQAMGIRRLVLQSPGTSREELIY